MITYTLLKPKKTHDYRFFVNSPKNTLASQSRFDPNWAVAQDLELELKSKLEPKLES